MTILEYYHDISRIVETGDHANTFTQQDNIESILLSKALRNLAGSDEYWTPY